MFFDATKIEYKKLNTQEKNEIILIKTYTTLFFSYLQKQKSPQKFGDFDEESKNYLTCLISSF